MNQKAPTKGKILAEIAPLLQYPGSDYKLKLENVIAVLAANCPAAVSPLEDFKKQIATLSIEDLEELYTRTFDVAPLASPYISVHIYGDENFDRGNLMATLATKFEEHGFEHENELPDHLALLLKFSGYLSEEELKELIEFCLGEPLEDISKTLKGSKSPNMFYYPVLAVQKVIKAG
ncbi:MAG: molecular chaperone TorD family protein [Cyanobacteriota/Melainabacteria group bacterium]